MPELAELAQVPEQTPAEILGGDAIMVIGGSALISALPWVTYENILGKQEYVSKGWQIDDLRAKNSADSTARDDLAQHGTIYTPAIDELSGHIADRTTQIATINASRAHYHPEDQPIHGVEFVLTGTLILSGLYTALYRRMHRQK